MTYLAVFEGKTWHMERAALVRALARDWPRARVDLAVPCEVSSEVRDVEWSYHSEQGELEGYAHADGCGIYLEGPIGLVADFVVWYRSLVPSEEEVVFCDDSYSFDGVVSPSATREDIIAIAE